MMFFLGVKHCFIHDNELGISPITTRATLGWDNIDHTPTTWLHLRWPNERLLMMLERIDVYFITRVSCKSLEFQIRVSRFWRGCARNRRRRRDERQRGVSHPGEAEPGPRRRQGRCVLQAAVSSGGGGEEGDGRGQSRKKNESGGRLHTTTVR